MVQRGVIGLNAAGQTAFADGEHRGRGGKGKELPLRLIGAVIAASCLYAPGIIELEAVFVLIKDGVIGRLVAGGVRAVPALFGVGIIIIVAVLVHLKQTLHVPERLFARLRALVEEIFQRLLFRGIFIFVVDLTRR